MARGSPSTRLVVNPGMPAVGGTRDSSRAESAIRDSSGHPVYPQGLQRWLALLGEASTCESVQRRGQLLGFKDEE